MVRYFGYYSNVSRGERKKVGIDAAASCILEPQGNEKALRKSWARLIQRIGACPGEGDCVVIILYYFVEKKGLLKLRIPNFFKNLR